MNQAAPIKVGRVELSQDSDGVAITHRGKAGALRVLIDAGKLERWALRVLREEAFGLELAAPAVPAAETTEGAR